MDEAQDFTQAELLLFWRICSNPNNCFIAGDTAQAIAQGVTFRFTDIKDMAREFISWELILIIYRIIRADSFHYFH